MSDRKALLKDQLAEWEQRRYDSRYIDDWERSKSERSEATANIKRIEAELLELERDGS